MLPHAALPFVPDLLPLLWQKVRANLSVHGLCGGVQETMQLGRVLTVRIGAALQSGIDMRTERLRARLLWAPHNPQGQARQSVHERLRAVQSTLQSWRVVVIEAVHVLELLQGFDSCACQLAATRNPQHLQETMQSNQNHSG